MEHGDLKGMTSSYATNAVAVLPGAPMMTGADAISKGFQQMGSAMKLSNVSLHTDDVMTGGDLAVQSGTWSWTATPANGKPQAAKGHFLTVWQRQSDGSWKMVRDFASDESALK